MQVANKLVRRLRGLAPRLALGAILLLSAFLNLYRLNTIGINGIGNYYYAAAVQTMLTSWRHFFFLSVDPAGFISLDKPPLAYWIQAASAKVLGFRGLSLLLPQAMRASPRFMCSIASCAALTASGPLYLPPSR